MKDLNISGYKITTEVKTGQHPAELEKQMPDLVRQSQDRKNKTIIPKLEKLIKKYPEVPALKNFLMTAYSVKGMDKRAQAMNDQLLKDHPDYLYARLNEANRMMSEDEIESVPEILGREMDIQFLYPQRNEFHISEVAAFLDTAIRYFILTENLEQAEIRVNIFKELAPDSYRTRELDEAVSALRMSGILEKLTGMGKDKISAERKEKPLPKQTTKPPTFHHPEVEELYYADFYILEDELDAILALPRPTLIQDLETLLKDSLNRYEYFLDEEGLEEADFVLHALFLLGELKATEALPAITSYLEYDDEFLDFWLGDHLTENLWRVFYQLGENEPEILQDILLNPQVNLYARSAVADALAQLSVHHPEKRAVALSIFKNLFQAILNAPPGDNLIDTEFTGVVAWSACDARFRELLPEIKQLYDKKYLLPHVLGTFPEIENIVTSPLADNEKKELLPLPQFYQKVVSTWYAYQKPAQPAKKPDFLKPASKPDKAISQFVKAGRNDPCPCGSGKKFKKCCGG